MDSVQPNDEPETMHIGELAERAGMSLRTIRHYDEVGLLVPSARTAGSFRVYTAGDLDRLLVIRRMKPLGFTLDEMADLLRIVDSLRARSAAPARTREARDADEIDARPAETDALAEQLDAYLDDARARHTKLVERAGMAEEFIGTLGSLRATLP